MDNETHETPGTEPSPESASLSTTIRLPEGLGAIAKRAARRQVRTLNGYITSLIAKDAVDNGLMTEEQLENLKPSTR